MLLGTSLYGTFHVNKFSSCKYNFSLNFPVVYAILAGVLFLQNIDKHTIVKLKRVCFGILGNSIRLGAGTRYQCTALVIRVTYSLCSPPISI